jgi:pyridoxamine 5'-phosphate oxidase
MQIEGMPKDYINKTLTGKDLDSDPVKQFEKWFKEASETDIEFPNAMSLATASIEGVPTIRTVLLKMFDANGFIFFTNYESKKAKQIHENPNVAILFLWEALGRQVTITGSASKISTSESFKYFSTRNRGSQLGAWISQQSSVISSRQFLEMKFQEIKKKFSDGVIPLPSFWGGYRIVPKTFEFWQGRDSRLNDRFLYSLNDEKLWVIQRLAP